ncbi:MAG TPA: 5'-methylthioadenosine/S-adenosylhomocysteine nucleosidase, partial [Rhizobiaceae bacterium]|nr:5'-methylthioadenosine/S-adenosylhomocysteine nucleosidase [Rhizobiaceae bacterium]
RTPFLDLPAVVRLPYRVEGLREATIATGASIVSGGGYDGIDADMVDMETWSVLRSAMGFGVPVIGLRGISDGAAELHRFDDWTQYLHVIDEKLADAVDRLEKAVAAGEIAL